MKTAVLVGESVLLIQCATLLERRGLRLAGIATDDPAVIAWASESRCVECVPTRDIRKLRVEEADFLFSIVNAWVLPADVVESPRVMAINYHDSLLPRHAGSHAVIAAILKGEAETGVTWHRMVARADAGDVLVQERVEIAAEETAASLNAKCAMAAITTFGRLVRGLLDDTLTPRPQDQTERTFHPRYQRPWVGCALDVQASAVTVDRTLRALSYGAGWNPLGSPKVVTDDGSVYLISSHQTRVERSELPVGAMCWLSSTRARIGLPDGTVEASLSALAGPCSTGSTRAISLEGLASARAFDDARCREEAGWLALYRTRSALRRPRPQRAWTATLSAIRPAPPIALLDLLERWARERAVMLEVFETAPSPPELLGSLYAAEVPRASPLASGSKAAFLSDFEARVQRAWPVDPTPPTLSACVRYEGLKRSQSSFDLEIVIASDGTTSLERFGTDKTADAAAAALTSNYFGTPSTSRTASASTWP